MEQLNNVISISVSDFDLKHNTGLLIKNFVKDLRAKPSFENITIEGEFSEISVDYNDLIHLDVNNDSVGLVYLRNGNEVSIILNRKSISCITLIRKNE